jgi:hypothetical protein
MLTYYSVFEGSRKNPLLMIKRRLIVDEQEDLKEEIARVAYEIYERTGICGRDEENWLEAERIVMERISVGKVNQISNKKNRPSKVTGTKGKKPSAKKRSRLDI